MASRLRAAALGLLLAASLAGCVSLPSGGPVLTYAVTQGPGGQSQPYSQNFPQPPGSNWTPSQIVQGFLTAAASFGSGQEVAREYLTPAFSKTWSPDGSAYVFSRGPTVKPVTVPATVSSSRPTAKPASSPKKSPAGPDTATVMVTGKVQETLGASGSYVIPSASKATVPVSFDLERVGSQWRISKSSNPTLLLLTSFQFSIDYQQRNLYFFDPDFHVLVPDPVYVPQLATPADLIRQLVTDLISPPKDWLYGATQSAFPHGTTIGAVTLAAGTATVNLGGSIGKVSAKVHQQVMQQVSAQLLLTLPGVGQSGPAVKTVEVIVNGKPWIPPGAQGNPVQTTPQYTPPKDAKTGVFYYVDHAGYLEGQVGTTGNPVQIGSPIGTGFTQIAVSPDGLYLAALRGSPQGGTLFTGPVGGSLVKRGAGYNSMSWDPSDDLWATSSDQVFMLRADPSQGPQGQPLPVNVVNLSGGNVPGPFYAIRVAPDGVRVAIIVDHDGGSAGLNFGAIVPKVTDPPHPSVISDKIVLSPFSVSAPATVFSRVTWYGNDNVITLSTPGPALTEYPVNGGSSTAIPAPPGIQSITASLGWSLIAGVSKLGMMADKTLVGVWTPIEKGVSPAYPG